MAELATADINDLPDSDFAYIEEGGTKDGSGKTVPRTLRHFPIQDAAHVRNALARAPQSPFGDKAMPKIKAAAAKFNIDVADDDDDDSSSRSLRVRETTRTYQMADATVRQDGSGRIVQAYITPFEHPTEIRDSDGHYNEKISRSAFAKTLADRGTNFVVLYNHGRTFDGKTDGNLQIPIGAPQLIEQHDRGLYSETEFLDNPLADATLDAIKKRAIRGFSFTGTFIKSHRTPGASRSGLPTVTRSEVSMREYGPVLFPAYETARIVGTRMADIIAQIEPEDLDRFRELLGIPTATPSGAGSERSEPPRHSTTQRNRETVRATYARFLSRSNDQ